MAARSRPSAPPDGAEECYAFASFRLYPKRRLLLRAEQPIGIGSRTFDLLLLLVAKAGTVVSVDELMGHAWPNLSVEEANLRVQMGALRKALSRCDQAQRAIETIPLRGYCFVLPVRHDLPEVAAASLRLPRDGNLPTLLDPIVGREEAIGLVRAALAERRLVTITGPGGIGKTTVAIATAGRCASDFEGGIAFVDLSQAPDGGEAGRVIADALGAEAHGDVIAALCRHLKARTLLLVLDTCEHVVEHVAELAEILLAHCPNLKLLVTSREALRATGEWVHRLAALTFPEEGEKIDEQNVAAFSAVTFFVDRVRASTRLEIQHCDFAVLGQICRRLDGIPLALEFAAARVADLGLREIAAHLDDRFSILTRARRTALSRHRTLSTTLDWSYNLLSNDEKCMLRCLAALSNSFNMDSAVAAATAAGCEQAQEALFGLFDKSLLTVDMRNGAHSYRLLDTIRAYAMSGGAERYSKSVGVGAGLRPVVIDRDREKAFLSFEALRSSPTARRAAV